MPLRRPRCQASSRSARRGATQTSGSRRPTQVTRGVHRARTSSCARRKSPTLSRRVDPSARSTRSSPRGASTPAASSSRSRRSRRALSSLSSRHWQCRQTRPCATRRTRHRLWPLLWPPSSRPLLPGFGARLRPRALADAGDGPCHSRRASPPRANCAPGSRSTTCTCLYA